MWGSLSDANNLITLPDHRYRETAFGRSSCLCDFATIYSRNNYFLIACSASLCMHFRSFICFLILTACVAGASWALGELADNMEFSNFMIFGAVAVTMASCGLAWDWFERRRS
jgi:hypothetical protein